jgi:5-hydroxyisourate hydrolase
MLVQLWVFDTQSGQAQFIKSTHTNADGRCDGPLLAGEELEAGIYELIFGVGDYFARQSLLLPDLPFLGLVPVRFAVADSAAHYHVPLLVSPWAYSTYRGS